VNKVLKIIISTNMVTWQMQKSNKTSAKSIKN